jgi:hypothetical protein
MPRCLGKLPPKVDPRTFKFEDFLKPTALTPLPLAPPARDWTSGLPLSLGFMGNDQTGDCTTAAAGHLTQVWTKLGSGTEITISDADILAAYSAVSGYNGTPSTDKGASMLDVLNYWATAGIGGHKIGAYALIDFTNVDHMQLAIDMFGGVYVGIALPKTAQDQTIWDVDGSLTGDSAPGSWGGHCVGMSTYDHTYWTVMTWGGRKQATQPWLSAYGDEAYVIISQEFVNGIIPAPSGFDMSALQNAILQLS